MKLLIPLLTVSLIATAAWFWWQSEPDAVVSSQPPDTHSDQIGNLTSAASQDGSQTSPFSLNTTDTTTDQTADPASLAAIKDDQVGTNDLALNEQALSAITRVEIDVSAIARAAISDEEHRALVDALKSDPALLQQLIDEFRQETSPDRLARLARLLGDVGGDAVVLLASELVFSGDEQSRKLGFQLLRDVEPGNEQVREIVSNMLSTEIEPDTLVGALTALSQPGQVDSQTSAYLSEQIADLTGHQSPSVRGISISILSRWTRDSRYNPVYVQALEDDATRVREAAAYALLGQQDNDPAVIAALFRTLSDVNEDKGVRRASVMALRRADLTADQQAEVDALERQLDTKPR